MEQIEEKIQNLKTTEDVIKYIKESTFDSPDMVYREIKVINETIYAVYNEALTDTDIISNFVVKSIILIYKFIVNILI